MPSIIHVYETTEDDATRDLGYFYSCDKCAALKCASNAFKSGRYTSIFVDEVMLGSLPLLHRREMIKNHLVVYSDFHASDRSVQALFVEGDWRKFFPIPENAKHMPLYPVIDE